MQTIRSTLKSTLLSTQSSIAPPYLRREQGTQQQYCDGVTKLPSFHPRTNTLHNQHQTLCFNTLHNQHQTFLFQLKAPLHHHTLEENRGLSNSIVTESQNFRPSIPAQTHSTTSTRLYVYFI